MHPLQPDIAIGEASAEVWWALRRAPVTVCIAGIGEAVTEENQIIPIWRNHLSENRELL